MIIYMRHQTHGNKIAMCELEAVADEKNGWERYEVGVLLTPKEPAEETVYVESLEDLREQYKVKFGKAPHHKKSIDTLRKELGYGDRTNSN